MRITQRMNVELKQSFWDYSLDAYSRPGVSELLLELQDSWGVDVNFLLYAGWMSYRGFALSVEHVSALDQQVAPWRNTVVLPLRELRRRLHGRSRGEAAYVDVKALELNAERLQQQQMEDCCRPGHRCYEDINVSRNCAVVAAYFAEGRGGWNLPVERLSQALSEAHGAS